jgi:hypothetical protein
MLQSLPDTQPWSPVSDAPGRFLIRPDPRRYRRHALSAAPLLLLAVAAVAARLAGEFGALAVPAVAALVGPPAALSWRSPPTACG